MDITLYLLGILLTVVPLVELRGGLPLALVAIKGAGVSYIILTFVLIVAINILLIFFIFFFLEHIHSHLMKWGFYKKVFDKYLERLQGKVDKLENKKGILVFVTLFLFVGVPLPLTGAYSGVVLSWLLGLDKKKSIVAVALGVLCAGIIIGLATTGLIGFFGF